MSDDQMPSTDEIEPVDHPADQAEVANEKVKPASRWPMVVMLLVLLLALVGAYYWAEIIHDAMFQGSEDAFAVIEQALDEVQQHAADNDLQSVEASAALEQVQKQLENMQATQDVLGDSVAELGAKDSATTQDWVLAEVEYLVFAANQRLVLERDVATAVAALKAADFRLRMARHPELLELRELLASDIGELEAVKMPDAEGLAIFLADILKRVDTLPTKPIAALDMPLSRMTDETLATQGWRAHGAALWADLKSLVEIKDGTLEDGVLFDPKLRYFLQQNLRLELSSARLSALKGDQANFRAAGSLIIELLETYYDVDDGAVAAIIAGMAEHMTLELAPTLPVISASLDALRAKRAALSAGRS
jgi:uroporphyrin-3 C-methyltransferase